MSTIFLNVQQPCNDVERDINRCSYATDGDKDRFDLVGGTDDMSIDSAF
ncbi:hypothetical protein HMPREF3201_00879 [Megasphaera sp. MJR8396C]|nr:hypothetical protein HMPREF3201_00879 [Megasphaera sp. MJR8396C]